MRVSFDFSKQDLANFKGVCEATINRVGNGSRKALLEACEEIMNESLMQVPVDTSTLMDSAFYEVTGDYKTMWEANLGYAGAYDPVNPKTGKPASSYALAVHEDLTKFHAVGKAKYLEDPVRAYAQERYPRTVFKYVREALDGLG